MKKRIKVFSFFFVLLSTIVFLTSCGNKKSNINLGMTKEEVFKKLGNPTDSDKGEYYWFGKAEKKYKEINSLVEKAFETGDEDAFNKADKLYKELQQMSFNFTLCSFAGDKLQEYYYDTKHKYDENSAYTSHNKKELKKVTIDSKTVDYYVDNRLKDNNIKFDLSDLAYSATFKDKSIYKAYVGDYSVSESGSSLSLSWKDQISEYKGMLKGNKIGEISSEGEIVSWSGDYNKIPNNVSKISDNILKEIDSDRLNKFDNGYYYGPSENPYKIFVRLVDNSVDSIIINENTERVISGSLKESNIKRIEASLSFFKKIELNYKGIEEIIISKNDTLDEDSKYSFGEYNNLKYIKISNKVTSLKNICFVDCTCDILWGDNPNITTISDSNFMCYRGENIIIPNSVTTIGNGAFYECNNITNIIIPNSVTTIESGAFWSCNNITNIIIPNSVTIIEGGAFGECEKLSSVTIIGEIKRLEECTFWNCPNLKSITIPGSVTSIECGLIQLCDKLTDVYYKGTAEDYAKITIDTNMALNNATKYYYSETQPATSGNYWHYDSSNNPVVW